MRKILLWPLGFLYGCVAALLRKIAEWKGRVQPEVFSVVVGNIAVGGTGKTPMIIQLAEILKQKGYSIAVLSRGYGRKTNGFYAVSEGSSAAEVGEEPLEIFRRAQVPVYVCENRLAGIARISPVDILLLDDGFQHLPLKAHFSVVLDNSKMPYYKNAVMPAGSLREFAYTLKEANAVVYTKTNETLSRNVAMVEAKKHVPHVFFAEYETQIPDLSMECGYILISGLADNKALKKSLEGYNIIKHFAYKDHYAFSPEDHKDWDVFLQKTHAQIITTGKDISKIKKNLFEKEPVIHVVHSKHRFEKGGMESLIQLILKAKEHAQ